MAIALAPSSPPTHHPPDELLIDYVSGSLSEAEALMIGIHLDLCAHCRTTVRAATAVAGSLFDALSPAPMPQTLFERTMRAIDASDRAPASLRRARPVPPSGADWPLALRTRLGDRPTGKWRRLPAGFRAMRIPTADHVERLWIVSAPGGRGPLRHSHSKDEWTVVLQGGFTDETGTYEAGDFAYMDSGEEHTMIAEPGEGCVCILMVRAYPVYLTLVGKLLAPLLRL